MSPLLGALATAALVGVGLGAGRRCLGAARGVATGGRVRARSTHVATRLRRRRDALRPRRARAALPELLEASARAASSGSALLPALSIGGEVTGGVLAAEIREVARRVDAGVPLAEALERWALDSDDPDVALVVAACRMGAQLGRGTASALAGIATSLSQARELRAELDVATSSARASALLLCALPVVVAPLLGLADPASLRALLGTPVGWACLLAAGLLDALGGWWMRALVRSVA